IRPPVRPRGSARIRRLSASPRPPSRSGGRSRPGARPRSRASRGRRCVMEPFLLRAFAAALALAVVAAPLGSLVIWNRMAYFGETIAQASLIGIALSLYLGVEMTVPVMYATLVMAGALVGLSRQKLVPVDAILGLLHHGALALGVILTLSLTSGAAELMGFLFGDILAVTSSDLVWIYAGGALVLA